ncbi:MAG: MarR family transcriptional regulator [Spirochaetales bacterium]|nr:MarR family transcriptional regulator [Spirochaetales bacterium]
MEQTTSTSQSMDIIANAIPRIFRWLRSFQKDFCRQFDLTRPQLEMLSLFDLEKGITPKNISDQLLIAPPNVTTAVAGLTKRGLVVVHPVPHDKRTIELKLTPEGAQLQEQIQSIFKKKFSAVLGNVQAHELETLAQGLQSLLRLQEYTS